MHGTDERSDGLFSYVSCEARVSQGQPLRAIREIVDEALKILSGDFEAMYSQIGRPSIAPEKLLRSLLLLPFFSIHSERKLMEQLDDNLMFRWFVGLSMDAAICDVTVFIKNRDRLIEGDIAAKFMAAVLQPALVRALLSSDHFTVDCTLIDAWASMKSFKPKDGVPGDGSDAGRNGTAITKGRNAERDFCKEKRSSASHASITDPDASIYKKAQGQAARLCHMGYILMKNRNGLIVDAVLTKATGTAKREAALTMLGRFDGR